MSSEKSGYPGTEGLAPPPYPAGEQHPQPGGYTQPYPGQPQPLNTGYGQGYNQPQYPGQGYTQPQSNVVTVQPYVQTATVVTQGPRPTNYMVPAILACLFCCWPIGICAIISASNANSAADRGDIVQANDKAKAARNLTIASVVFGVIWIAAVIVYRAVLISTTTVRYNSL